jgi:hypothetical protein
MHRLWPIWRVPIETAGQRTYCALDLQEVSTIIRSTSNCAGSFHSVNLQYWSNCQLDCIRKNGQRWFLLTPACAELELSQDFLSGHSASVSFAAYDLALFMQVHSCSLGT